MLVLFHLTFAFIGSLLTGLQVTASERPNILWLTSEDHGPEMGCYDDPIARTPHVDALAAKGMLFHRAWSTHPVCAPARSAIITGLHANSSGGVHMRSMVPMPTGAKMFPEYLREAGYYCTNNVKEDYNLPKTAQTWDDSSNQAHWSNRPAGQPFFAVFNSTKSHESQIRSRPHQAITDPSQVRVPAYHPDLPEVREDWAQYYDKISEADADAGARLRELALAGLADDTIVFYYGDHGHGLPRGKRWPSNSGLHVPMVVYFPPKWQHLAPVEYAPGGRSERLVDFVDLAPTVLSIAGMRPPEWMQGHAFAGPHQTAPQPYIYGSRGRMDERQDTVRSITDGRYVYLRNFFTHVSQAQRVTYQFQTPTTRVWRELFDAGGTNEEQSIFWRVPKAPEELYDLQTDPDEVRNLASLPEYGPVLARLRTALYAHLEEIRDVTFLPESDMHARSAGGSPHDMARRAGIYPFERVFAAADLASRYEVDAAPQLRAWLTDSDSAVRYWAVMGFHMRGRAAVLGEVARLRRALNDDSPWVRIAAAETLGTHGEPQDLAPALAVLREQADPERQGVFSSMAALSVIEGLGSKAVSLHDFVRALNADTGMPDRRFGGYVSRLVQNITATNPSATDGN